MLSQSTSATVRRGSPVCGTRAASPVEQLSSEKSLSFVTAHHRIDIASPSPSQVDDLSCCRAATVPARLACIGLSCVLASLTAAVPLAVHACHLVGGFASRHGQRFRCDQEEANVHLLTCYVPPYPRIPPLLSTRSTTFSQPGIKSLNGCYRVSRLVRVHFRRPLARATLGSLTRLGTHRANERLSSLDSTEHSRDPCR
jgi:hypothetical protein